MLNLDEAIRAKLADYGEDPCGYATCIVVGFSEMRAAITAVLDLHALDDPLWPDADGKLERVGPPGTTCVACVADPYWIGTEKSEMAEDPCPTKRAIAKALGIEVSCAGS